MGGWFQPVWSADFERIVIAAFAIATTSGVTDLLVNGIRRRPPVLVKCVNWIMHRGWWD